MRKILASLFMTLDGVTESPEKWSFSHYSDEVEQAVQRHMDRADAMLMGRRTYQAFAQYWPTQGSEVPSADFMNNSPKYVVSTTLDNVDEWQNSVLVQSDVADEIATLKQQPGKDISISGSSTLVRALLEYRLLDELQLLVYPVVVGSGARLFDGQSEELGLTLVDSTTFETGVVALRYEPAGN